jgi:UDP-glucose 4-epimerase
MRTLVTGGAGFIGSHLVDALVNRGDEVAIIDDLSSGKPENVANAIAVGATLFESDIRDQDSVRRIFEKTRPELVFHLAAQMDVRRSVADPTFDASVNVAGTVNLLQCSHLLSTKRFVFLSTGGAIYGDNPNLPISESEDALPLSPYGQSKLADEGYVDFFHRVHGVNGVTLRLANVFGPRQDPHGEGGVVAIFCGKYKEGKSPTIFGDGEQTRDFVFVQDVVRATLLAASANVPGPINIGSGVETSVLELVRLVGHQDDKTGFDPVFAEEREGEIARAAIDPAKAKAELGWEAETGVEAGLKLTLEHLSVQPSFG